MAEISEDELEAIQEGFDTYSLLGAIDQLDVIRGHLGPSELRENLLKLHGLAMEVINEGFADGASEMFELAQEIDDQLFDISEALEKLQETISKLTDLQPESLQWGD
jgi:hypothetical protein